MSVGTATISEMKTVIFDFDGTIADTLQLTVDIFNEIAADYQLPPIQPKDIPDLKNFSAKELVKRYRLSPWQLFRLVRKIQSRQKKKIISAKLIVGMPSLLTTLRQHAFTVGIVTSNSRENVELFLKCHGIEDVAFIYSEKNIFGKGAVLKNLLKKKAIRAQDTYYVGDEVRDIEAGKQANIPVIAVTWGYNSRKRLEEAHPDRIIDTPEQLGKEIC